MHACGAINNCDQLMTSSVMICAMSNTAGDTLEPGQPVYALVHALQAYRDDLYHTHLQEPLNYVCPDTGC